MLGGGVSRLHALSKVSKDNRYGQHGSEAGPEDRHRAGFERDEQRSQKGEHKEGNADAEVGFHVGDDALQIVPHVVPCFRPHRRDQLEGFVRDGAVALRRRVRWQALRTAGQAPALLGLGGHRVHLHDLRVHSHNAAAEGGVGGGVGRAIAGNLGDLRPAGGHGVFPVVWTPPPLSAAAPRPPCGAAVVAP